MSEYLASDKTMVCPDTIILMIDSNVKISKRQRHSDPLHHRKSSSILVLIIDNSSRDNTPQLMKTSSETNTPSKLKSPQPHLPHDLQQGGYYLDFPPLKTITIVFQRTHPTKPRNMHIPFYGRHRTRSKEISLDKLWELHYRLRRSRKTTK